MKYLPMLKEVEIPQFIVASCVLHNFIFRSLLDSKVGDVSYLGEVSKLGDLLRDSRWFVYVISGFPHAKNRNDIIFLQADWLVV